MTQRKLPSLFVIAVASMVSVCSADADEGEATGIAQPNVIVFLTDDQGWGDLGCYGHPRIKSPNLDRFATEGLRFTQCYAGDWFGHLCDDLRNRRSAAAVRSND